MDIPPFRFLLPIFVTSIAQAAPVPDYARDIKPLLAKHCYECHGPDKKKGDLRLDSRASAFHPAESGDVVIVAGKSAKSPVFQRVTSSDPDEQMPPRRGSGGRLSPKEIETLKVWIDAGASWPEVEPRLRHWAYEKPVRPALPAVKNTVWPKNPVDRFILARLEARGLAPSPDASLASLCRRMFLDLTGLPPKPAQVDAFIEAAGRDLQTAMERLADELLASPQYGERWARPWLDLARYADSNGFQRDGFRDLWAYRDWVVRAMNRDMPYDQFSIEQLAGDLLPGATEEQRTATGFHRCTTVNVEAGTDQEENRTNQVLDRVNTTGTVWLGTSIECAQCHNHKYDPFTQRDYYRLYAYFNNTERETAARGKEDAAAVDFTGPYMPLGDASAAQRRTALEARRDLLSEQLAALGKGEGAPAEENSSGTWHPLQPASFASSSGADGRVLEDGCVLVGGKAPAKDTYTIVFHTKLKGITALKLDALTDDSLPGKGPGRGDAERPNFVLNEFNANVASESDPANGKPVQFVGARADFSQSKWEPLGAVDDDAKTGWAIAPEFHKSHWAVFAVGQPFGDEDGAVLTVTLEQNFGQARTLGRFRISALVGNDEQPVASAPGRGGAEGKRVKKELDAVAAQLASLKTPQTLVMRELEKARETHLFQRGDFLQPGERVEPGVPDCLQSKAAGPPNRLTLARWLVNRENPLTARVAVNRWWAEIFGVGIVSTLEDFGVKGDLPSHPELLDWLSVEFMDGGWHMKRIHKLIVTSATYRQSSRVTPELLAQDPDNNLLGRFPRLRLDAEAVRDNALAVSGLLSLKQGGPPIRPWQPAGIWTVTGLVDNTYRVSEGEDRWRRGLYVVWRRSAPYPSFVTFDSTIRSICTVKRSRSNTPLQALVLLNDPVYLEAAHALARRACAERPGASLDEQITHAFRLTLARLPRPEEIAALRKLHAAQLARYLGDEKAAREFFGEFPAPKEVPSAEFAALSSVAMALLNLDETIARN